MWHNVAHFPFLKCGKFYVCLLLSDLLMFSSCASQSWKFSEMKNCWICSMFSGCWICGHFIHSPVLLPTDVLCKVSVITAAGSMLVLPGVMQMNMILNTYIAMMSWTDRWTIQLGPWVHFSRKTHWRLFAHQPHSPEHDSTADESQELDFERTSSGKVDVCCIGCPDCVAFGHCVGCEAWPFNHRAGSSKIARHWIWPCKWANSFKQSVSGSCGECVASRGIRFNLCSQSVIFKKDVNNASKKVNLLPVPNKPSPSLHLRCFF